MKPEIIIQDRKIGLNHPPLVIAEIGINHGGNLDNAIEMVDAAIDAGAEIIKHQTHVIDDEMTVEAKTTFPGNSDKSIYEIMKECALSEDDEYKLKEYVESKIIIFISTPFSRAAANRLEKMNVSAYKIGSGECNNYPLVKHIASFGKPVILSTGMNDIGSIQKSVDILRKNNIPYALLHCTNAYPAPISSIRLGAVSLLKQKFPDAVIGLSDHTTSNLPCLGAVALGASILERHFTDSFNRIGPDISCSMDPKQTTELIKQSKLMWQARGDNKGPAAEEEVTIKFAFASVCTIKDISPGEVLSENNIWVKRPGTGDFNAEDYESLLGQTAKNFILKNTQIKKQDIL